MDFGNKNAKTEEATREIAEILRRVDALAVLDGRSPDEIIGYDERGLPA
jgi:hypothetical protein